VDGKDRHIALIVEKGMDGFEVGERFDTMASGATTFAASTSRMCAIPPENVIGEPGDGFRIAVQVLNNGRLSLGRLGGRGRSGCSTA